MTFPTVHRGEAPLLVSIPHTGTDIPAEIAPRLVSMPLALRDTDWWIERLYDFAESLGATVIRTAVSRSVIDVNRDPSGVSLYPGQATTGLCPTTTFDGRPLYREGEEPDEAEITLRRLAFFDPYHTALSAEIRRLRARHERIVLYDCHSIRSRVSRLFEGELPVLNIGTNDTTSCHPAVEALAMDHAARSPFSFVANGRFKGGFITRGHGRPGDGVHAIQMETACRGYMDERDDNAPAAYEEARAAEMREVLRRLLTELRDWAASKG